MYKIDFNLYDFTKIYFIKKGSNIKNSLMQLH